MLRRRDLQISRFQDVPIARFSAANWRLMTGAWVVILARSLPMHFKVM
jgi:hypothetical protein